MSDWIERCGVCGAFIAKGPGAWPNESGPCLKCGEREHRRVEIKVKDEAQFKSMLNVEHNVHGVQKSVRELRVGDSYWRDGEKWVYLERRIDRARDRYTKTITDPGGTVIYEADEPLSQHRGHGSARGKK